MHWLVDRFMKNAGGPEQGLLFGTSDHLAMAESLGPRPYDSKRAKWLGVVHIVSGCLLLAMDLFFLLQGDSPTFGIFASVAWFLSGGFALGGAVSRTRCMVLATMVGSWLVA